jgi:hypothetical protein
MGGDHALHQLLAVLGQGDQRVALGLRIGPARDQPGLDEPVDAHADRARGQPELVHQPPLAHALRRAQPDERHQRAEARRAQPVRGEHAVQLALDVRPYPTEARDDRHRREVDVRARLVPGGQQRVDRVMHVAQYRLSQLLELKL